MAEKREHSIHVRLCYASDAILMLGVIGCGLAFCGYVIGVVVQEAPNYEISNVGDE